MNFVEAMELLRTISLYGVKSKKQPSGCKFFQYLNKDGYVIYVPMAEENPKYREFLDSVAKDRGLQIGEYKKFLVLHS